MIDGYDEQALGHDIVVAGFFQLQSERHLEWWAIVARLLCYCTYFAVDILSPLCGVCLLTLVLKTACTRSLDCSLSRSQNFASRSLSGGLVERKLRPVPAHPRRQLTQKVIGRSGRNKNDDDDGTVMRARAYFYNLPQLNSLQMAACWRCRLRMLLFRCNKLHHYRRKFWLDESP